MIEKLKSLLYPEKKGRKLLYLTLSGILSGMCMTFPTAFGAVLEWLSLVPAALVFCSACNKGVKLKDAYWGTFWLIYSQHVVVYHWFVSFYPLEFTGMTRSAAAAVVFVAIFGLSLLASMFSGLLGIIVVASARFRLAKRFPIIMPFSTSG